MSSIKEIAKAAGVSVTTVSYVLNGKGNLSPQTRQHVLEVIQRLNYTPNIRARNLRTQESRIVGYAWPMPLTPREGSPVLDTFLRETLVRLEALGFHILLFNEPAQDKLRVYSELIDSGRVDGFILSNTEAQDERIAFLHEKGIPFVSFGRSASPLDALTAWVDIDGCAGVKMAMQHLIEQGHERIGLLCWPENSVAGDARFQGYQEALEEYQLLFDPALIFRGENRVSIAYENTHYMMTQPDPPTAIVALSDTLAIGALSCLQELGMSAAVIGYDDIPGAEYTAPPLSSVRQPIEEVALLLVEMLHKQLRGEPLPETHSMLKPELIVRMSSLINQPGKEA
jgi:DNA-binding LacI/PurR family transcriptional regulator